MSEYPLLLIPAVAYVIGLLGLDQSMPRKRPAYRRVAAVVRSADHRRAIIVIVLGSLCGLALSTDTLLAATTVVLTSTLALIFLFRAFRRT
jgi:hypothetical protein